MNKRKTRTLLSLAALAMAGLSGAASAAAPTDALTRNACSACHGVGNKIVGPAFADVAKKYAGKANAKATLKARIKSGGSGAWGQVPMPPQPNLSDADLKQIVDWLAGGAKP
jgi:cytochrome c